MKRRTQSQHPLLARLAAAIRNGAARLARRSGVLLELLVDVAAIAGIAARLVRRSGVLLELLVDVAAIAGVALIGLALDSIHHALGTLWIGAVLLVGAILIARNRQDHFEAADKKADDAN